MQARWQVVLVLTVARTSMGVQFQSIAAVAAGLRSEFALSFGDIGALIGLYFLPGIFLALPAAALGRKYGDRRVVLAGLTLCVAGGLLCALAPSFGVLAAGRVIAGMGAVALNVLMSKMVTDWFAGERDIVLAMPVFVNSFPIGVGLALLICGGLAGEWGWRVGLMAPPLACALAMALLALAYRPHGNDRAGVALAGGITLAEALLVCLAGAIWGIFNGGFGAMFGFAPSHLAGLGVAGAALAVSAATWALVASCQCGGILAQRGVAPGRLMVVGSLGWCACLALLAQGATPPALWMVLGGLVMGLPVGVIMSLPARVLRPESRALGMGLFYLWLYIGHAGVPPLAGALQDVSGSPAAPFWFMAGLALLMLGLYLAFRLGAARLVSRRAAAMIV